MTPPTRFRIFKLCKLPDKGWGSFDKRPGSHILYIPIDEKAQLFYNVYGCYDGTNKTASNVVCIDGTRTSGRNWMSKYRPFTNERYLHNKRSHS